MKKLDEEKVRQAMILLDEAANGAPFVGLIAPEFDEESEELVRPSVVISTFGSPDGTLFAAGKLHEQAQEMAKSLEDDPRFKKVYINVKPEGLH